MAKKICPAVVVVANGVAASQQVPDDHGTNIAGLFSREVQQRSGLHALDQSPFHLCRLNHGQDRRRAERPPYALPRGSTPCRQVWSRARKQSCDLGHGIEIVSAVCARDRFRFRHREDRSPGV